MFADQLNDKMAMTKDLHLNPGDIVQFRVLTTHACFVIAPLTCTIQHQLFFMIFSETLAPKRVQKFSITFEHEVKN
jgi:hypothetical protein